MFLCKCRLVVLLHANARSRDCIFRDFQLPAFVKLSNDAIWGVRKGCVESLVAVAKSVPAEIRASVFIPMFERFAKDVRLAKLAIHWGCRTEFLNRLAVSINSVVSLYCLE